MKRKHENLVSKFNNPYNIRVYSSYKRMFI